MRRYYAPDIHDQALKKAFGKYGKLVKVVLNKNNLSSNGKILGSAFLTYHRRDEALYCIKHLDGMVVDGSTIRLVLIEGD